MEKQFRYTCALMGVVVLIAAGSAHASSVHWDDGPASALSVAAGKAASWAAMHDGALLFKEATRGNAQWRRCGGLSDFKAVSVAARGNDALVASDDGRTVLMRASYGNNGLRCDILSRLGSVQNIRGNKILIRDVGFGLALYALGEDGELYLYRGDIFRGGRWERDAPLNNSRPSAILNTIHRETRGAHTSSGRVVCELPGQLRSFLIQDGKHDRNLIAAGNQARHHWKNHDGQQPYSNSAVWHFERLDGQCLFRLRVHGGGYLRTHDGNRITVMGGKSEPDSFWRLVTSEGGNGSVRIINYRTGTALGAGDNYDSQIYHAPYVNKAVQHWRLDAAAPRGTVPGDQTQPVDLRGDGKYFVRGVQAMRVSSDLKHRRLWFTGSNNRVASFVATEGRSGTSVNGRWVGVQQHAVDFHNDGSGRTWWVTPSGELFQAQGSNDGGRTWVGRSQIGSGLTHVAVSQLGYPVAIRNNGVLAASSPGRDNSVPNAASCSARDPFSWVSNYAQAHYGKLKSDVTGLANAVASGDYKSALSRVAAMQAQYPTGPFTPDIMGEVLGATGVSELKAIHAAVQQSRLAGNQEWARAVAGDIDVATKHNAGVALYHLGRGDAAAAARVYTENPYVKYYILGPIREIDWSRPSALILAELQAKYYQRALKAKSELRKYTPAGAAQYSINAAFKNALAAHGPDFINDPLGLNLPPNSRPAMAASNMIAAALIEMGEDFEPPAEPSGPSGLYAQAVATPVTAREVWNDSGSGGDNDGAFYTPVVGRNNDDCISLGDYMQRGGTRPPKQLVQLCNARAGKGVWWERPVDYDFIWSDRCSGANADGSIWLPVCPTGFAPMGFVTNDTADVKPWLDRVACLRRSSKTLGFAKSNSLKWAWNDRGSGATFNVEVMNRYFGPVPLMVAYPAYRDTNEVRNNEYFFDQVQAIRRQGVSDNFDF